MQFGFTRRLSALVRVGGVAALVLVSAARAAASPVTYSEAVSGDLSFALPMAAPFTFESGVNTISGHTFFDENGSDFDSFAFSIPTGAQLTGINLSFNSQFTPGVYQADLRYGLSAGNAYVFPPDLGDMKFDLLAGSPGAVFGGAIPLGAGTYGVSFISMQLGGNAPTGFYTDYTWSFTVEGPAGSPVVPEPASLLLFGTGLIASVRRFRRRR